MTARERADKVLKAMESHGFLDGSPDTLAMNVVALLGHAGLAVVDAKLHEALVQAVRALAYRRAYDAENRWGLSRALDHRAHDHAVALLAERGE